MDVSEKIVPNAAELRFKGRGDIHSGLDKRANKRLQFDLYVECWNSTKIFQDMMMKKREKTNKNIYIIRKRLQ